MDSRQQDEPEKRDWRVSATLLAVWIIALAVIAGRSDTIPLSMLAIATVFFVMLIPAMNDMVTSIEKYIARRSRATSETNDPEGR